MFLLLVASSMWQTEWLLQNVHALILGSINILGSMAKGILQMQLKLQTLK